MSEPTDAEFLREVTRTHPLPMMVGLRLRAIAGRLDKAEQGQPVRDPSTGEPVPGTGCAFLIIAGWLLWLL